MSEMADYMNATSNTGQPMHDPNIKPPAPKRKRGFNARLTVAAGAIAVLIGTGLYLGTKEEDTVPPYGDLVQDVARAVNKLNVAGCRFNIIWGGGSSEEDTKNQAAQVIAFAKSQGKTTVRSNVLPYSGEEVEAADGKPVTHGAAVVAASCFSAGEGT